LLAARACADGPRAGAQARGHGRAAQTRAVPGAGARARAVRGGAARRGAGRGSCAGRARREGAGARAQRGAGAGRRGRSADAGGLRWKRPGQTGSSPPHTRFVPRVEVLFHIRSSYWSAAGNPFIACDHVGDGSSALIPADSALRVCGTRSIPPCRRHPHRRG